MTADERRAMRELLRASIDRGLLPGASPHAPGAFRRNADPPSNMVARFTAELTALGGAVHTPERADAAAIAAIVATVASGESKKRALMWDDRWLPIPGVADALQSVGFEVERQHEADLQSNVRRTELATACVGITGADAACAETGSIVLVSGPGRGRLASLLPPLHVAIVRRSAMLRSLPDLLAARPELAVSGSNLVCITGPSRTADIEHTLSRGVHGPREVHVILVE